MIKSFVSTKRSSFGTYRHIICLNRNPTIWVHSHSPNITSREMRWSGCMNRMIKIPKNKQAATHSSASFHREWKVFSGTLPMRLAISNLKRTELLTSCLKCFNPLSWIPAGFVVINLIVLQSEKMVISALLSLALQKQKPFGSELIKLIQPPLSFLSQHHSRGKLI